MPERHFVLAGLGGFDAPLGRAGASPRNASLGAIEGYRTLQAGVPRILSKNARSLFDRECRGGRTYSRSRGGELSPCHELHKSKPVCATSTPEFVPQPGEIGLAENGGVARAHRRVSAIELVHHVWIESRGFESVQD